MDEAGVLDHQIVDAHDVERAVHSAPAVGRARARGELIQRLSSRRDSLRCNWHRIVDGPGRRVLDLSDPFKETNDGWDAPRRRPPKRAPADTEQALLRAILGR
jgi:hypothetical protein